MSARMCLPFGGRGPPHKKKMALGNSWCLRQPQGPEVKEGAAKSPAEGGSDLDCTTETPVGRCAHCWCPASPTPIQSESGMRKGGSLGARKSSPVVLVGSGQPCPLLENRNVAGRAEAGGIGGGPDCDAEEEGRSHNKGRGKRRSEGRKVKRERIWKEKEREAES